MFQTKEIKSQKIFFFLCSAVNLADWHTAMSA